MKRRSWIFCAVCAALGVFFLAMQNPVMGIGGSLATLFFVSVVVGGFALWMMLVFKGTRSMMGHGGGMSPKAQQLTRLGIVGAMMWRDKHNSGGPGSSGGFTPGSMHGPEN